MKKGMGLAMIILFIGFFIIILLSTGDQTIRSNFNSDQFGVIQVIRPKNLTFVAFVFVDQQQRNTPIVQQALQFLNKKGAAAFIIDSTYYLDKLKTENNCSYIGDDIERLGQALENNIQMSNYVPPLLIGFANAAVIPYVARIQNLERFSGTFLEGFCPRLPDKVNFCETDQLRIITDKSNNAFLKITSAPTQNLIKNFYIHFAESDSSCISDQNLAQIIPGIQIINSSINILNTLNKVLENSQPLTKLSNSLPLIELPALSDHPNNLALFLSGDGGWAGLDQDTGNYLRSQGMSVIGFNSLKYFWNKKTPEKTAADIELLLNHYSAKWQLENLILIGYSLGAEALPLIYPRLSKTVQDKIKQVILIAPGEKTDLQVHISDWLRLPVTIQGMDLSLEINKIPSKKLLCLIGTDDSPGACSNLNGFPFSIIKLPGDHHFDGDYRKLGQIIIERIRTLEE